MRKLALTVAKYHGSKTSKFVVEGLRVNGKRTRKFFGKRRGAEAWLRKTMVRLHKEGEGAIRVIRGEPGAWTFELRSAERDACNQRNGLASFERYEHSKWPF